MEITSFALSSGGAAWGGSGAGGGTWAGCSLHAAIAVAQAKNMTAVRRLMSEVSCRRARDHSGPHALRQDFRGHHGQGAHARARSRISAITGAFCREYG